MFPVRPVVTLVALTAPIVALAACGAARLRGRAPRPDPLTQSLIDWLSRP